MRNIESLLPAKSCMHIAFIALPFLLLSVSQISIAQKGKKAAPVSIIFDTDMGPDYDDVGAIAMLHAMADSGECKILATIASNSHAGIAGVLNILNTYFRRPGLPVGVVRGPSVNIGAKQKWDSLLLLQYPHTLKKNDDAYDALKLYRKLLAAQPDKSVTIVTVGFLTNMANLLQSGPDEFSPLSGKDLVIKKVKHLVSMAARFDAQMETFREFNVVKDALASQKVFDSWPTPILFSGFEIGVQIFTGLPIMHSAISSSPVKDVFALSIPFDPQDVNGRMSWDETAVLVAVRGYQKYFNAVPGKIISHADGSNGWDKTGTRDLYLVHKLPPASIASIIDGMMMHQPRR